MTGVLDAIAELESVALMLREGGPAAKQEVLKSIYRLDQAIGRASASEGRARYLLLQLKVNAITSAVKGGQNRLALASVSELRALLPP
jgi:hypothetical protein